MGGCGGFLRGSTTAHATPCSPQAKRIAGDASREYVLLEGDEGEDKGGGGFVDDEDDVEEAQDGGGAGGGGSIEERNVARAVALSRVETH